MNEKMQKSILFAGDCIGFRALIFFDLVKYHMEVRITEPSKKNNLNHLNNESGKCNMINDMIISWAGFQCLNMIAIFEQNLNFPWVLKIPTAKKYQC